MRTIQFTCLGQPATAGSKRHVGRGILVDSSGAKGKAWRSVVQDAAADANNGGGLLEGELALQLTFYAPRPKSHYGTGRNRNTLKPSAPARPITRPDALKLARAVEDALSGVLYRDDSQIATETISKRYGEPARCEVTLLSFE